MDRFNFFVACRRADIQIVVLAFATQMGFPGEGHPQTAISTRIPTPWLREGSVQIRYIPGITPLEITEHLVWSSGSKKFRIGKELLRGRVRINTERAALGYVNLFSNPRTAHTVQFVLGLELTERESISRSDWRFKGHPGAVAGKTSEGYLGICSKKTLRGFSNWAPTAKRVGNNFVVSRVVIKETAIKRTYSVFRVGERIGTDGSYKLLGVKRAEFGNHLQWSLPVFD